MIFGNMAFDLPETVQVIGACVFPNLGFWAGTGPWLSRYHAWYSRKLSSGHVAAADSVRLVNVTTRNVSVGFASYIVWKEGGGLDSDDGGRVPLIAFGALMALYWTYHPFVLGARWTRWGVAHSALMTLAAATTMVLFWRVSQPAGVTMIPFLIYAGTVTAHNWDNFEMKKIN